MRILIDNLLSNNLIEAKEVLNQVLNDLVEIKLNQVKMRLSEKMTDDMDEDILDSEEIDNEIGDEIIDEGIRNILKTGRTKLIRVRIRKGKIQRRKKLSDVKGWTMRGGRLTRMSPTERRNRKMAARRAKLKRRSKLRQSMRKRQMSLRKRRAMGL